MDAAPVNARRILAGYGRSGAGVGGRWAAGVGQEHYHDLKALSQDVAKADCTPVILGASTNAATCTCWTG
jgi:hypothetical protein